jgi:tRNA threonylcarbamoyl adenosine modification protein (Sua5/YciO/YrdC/YwlC family)
MSALLLTVHSKTPELRKIAKATEILKNGGVILFPTDTGFTLGCELSNKVAIEKIRTIRRLPDKKALTFLCSSLSNIAEFAKVSNAAYKAIKRLIPGTYTFILPASKNVPRLAQDPKRKTAGIRVPDNTLSQLLLKALDAPLISITAKFEGTDNITDPEELLRVFSPFVDVAVGSDEYNFAGESTVINMTTDDFTIFRRGAGYENVAEQLGIED